MKINKKTTNNDDIETKEPRNAQNMTSKTLRYMRSLFDPTRMYERRKINIFFSILILLLASYILSVPMSNYASETRYTTFATEEELNVLYYADDEKTQALDDYFPKYTEYATFDELKSMGVEALSDGLNYVENVEDAHDYILKSAVPVIDADSGAITDYEYYYIHVVFDYTPTDENIENETYYVSDFDKLIKENTDENHFLLLFREDGLVYRNRSDAESDDTDASITYWKDLKISFRDSDNMEEVAHQVIDELIPHYKLKCTQRTFLFACLFPAIWAILLSLIIGKTGYLKGIKEYINIAAVSTIGLAIVSFAISFISLGIGNFIFSYYSILFALYYSIIIIVNNRRNRSI